MWEVVVRNIKQLKGTVLPSLLRCVLIGYNSIVRRIIRECRRVLKPGGKLTIFEHNTYNPVTRKVVNDCIFDEDAILLSSREAERRMRQARMHNIECRYTIFFLRKGIFKKFIPLEKYLSKIPLGGQYYITSEK